jgi:hypothetical protein
MHKIKIKGPHMETILAFCDHPSIQQRWRWRERDRERERIKKESNECQYFTLHVWNGKGRKLHLQQWEPMLILWQIWLGTETCAMVTCLYNNDHRTNHCCCLPALADAHHNFRTACALSKLVFSTHSLTANSNGVTLWGPKLAYIMHNNSVQCASIRNTNLLCWSCKHK